MAGSSAGITALQLDVKLFGGVPPSILTQALLAGRRGRLQILETMGLAFPDGVPLSVTPHAPKVAYLQYVLRA